MYILFKQYSVEKNIIIITLSLYKCLEAFSDTLYGYMQKNKKEKANTVNPRLNKLNTRDILIISLYIALFDTGRSKKIITNKFIITKLTQDKIKFLVNKSTLQSWLMFIIKKTILNLKA